MEFLKAEQFDGAPADIDALCVQRCSYDRLHAGIDDVCETLPLRERKSLRLLIVQDGYECLAVYLATLNVDSALMARDVALNARQTGDFAWEVRPGCSLSLRPAGFRKKASNRTGWFVENEYSEECGILGCPGLMLSTTGPMVGPKFVRFAVKNPAAKDNHIAQYLRSSPLGWPLTSLSVSLLYGLPVLDSCLQADVTMVLTTTAFYYRNFGAPLKGAVAPRLREFATPLKSCRRWSCRKGRLIADGAEAGTRESPKSALASSYIDWRSRGFGSALRRMASRRQPPWIS